MTRSFSPTDLVQLPRATVNDGLALGAAVLSRAQAAGKLPPALKKACVRLHDAYEQLRQSVRQRLQESGGDTVETREADRALDTAWVAAHQWSLGWSRLPALDGNDSHVDAAGQIQARLFTDGVRFTQFRYRDEWVESQARMDIIESEELAPLFAQLGGERILESLRETHATYGRVLGLTAVDEDDSTLPPGEVLRLFLDELRRYVIQVSAHADPDDPGTEALSEDLLTPLMYWQPTPAAAAGDEVTTDEPGAEPDPSDLPPAEPISAARADAGPIPPGDASQQVPVPGAPTSDADTPATA